MKYKCYCLICQKLIGLYSFSQKRKTCSKKCKSKLTSEQTIGVNNPNFRHGRCYFPHFCINCEKKIDKYGRSKRCSKCNSSKYPAFEGKHHTEKSKKIIGKKSKAKWTKKYIEKNYTKKFQGNKKRAINGYILIKAYNHPNRNKQNDMLEHRLIMEKYLGRRLKKREIIHHINFVRDDNRVENLYLCFNISSHLQMSRTIFKLVNKLLKMKIIKFTKRGYQMNRRSQVVMGDKP